MDAETTTDNRTRWGRLRFAGGRIPALAVAIPVGLILAVGVGALTLATGVSRSEDALLIAGVFALVMSWGLIGLVWAIIVDRSTLRGALPKPEESVEATWLDTAMSGAFGDTIMLTGFTVVFLAITGVELDAMWALLGVLCVAFFSAFVRYLIVKKRG